MTTVSSIYFPRSGNTATLVEAIEKGASSVDCVKTNLIAISGENIVKGRYQNALAIQHGMILVGLGEMPGQPNGVIRLGGWGGAMAQSTSESPAVSPSRDDLLTAEKLGRRVATSAATMKG
jgi:NAD(P)H dehydrogenase (quinone)